MKNNTILGKNGEKIAEEYLKKLKYTIIERNFRIRNGEIDLIAIDYSEKIPVLSFIEVKTRNSDRFGTPFDAITPWKVNFLIRTANVYKVMHPKMPDAMRIDAVSVSIVDGEPKVELMKNISF